MLFQLMEVDTKGICLFCLREDCDKGQSGVSPNGLKNFLDYAQVNAAELINCNESFLELMNIGNDFEVRITLCSECSLVTKEFDRSYSESLKSSFDNCVEYVVKSINDGDNDPKRVQEYINRMRPKKFTDLVNASIAANLREKLKSCTSNINSTTRIIQIIDLEAESFSYHIANSNSHAKFSENHSGISTGGCDSTSDRTITRNSMILSEPLVSSTSTPLAPSVLNQMGVLMRQCEASMFPEFLQSAPTNTVVHDMESSDIEDDQGLVEEQLSQESAISELIAPLEDLPESANSAERPGIAVDNANESTIIIAETDENCDLNLPENSPRKGNSPVKSPSPKKRKAPNQGYRVRKCRRSKLPIGPITCDICFHNFPSQSTLTDHITQAHTPSRKAKVRQIKVAKNARSKCPSCDFKALLPKDVTHHQIETHLSRVVIESLAQPLSEQKVEQAINSIFGDMISNDWTCFICAATYQRRQDNLRSHVVNCHFDSLLNNVLTITTALDDPPLPYGADSYLLSYLGLKHTPDNALSCTQETNTTTPISKRLPLRRIQPKKGQLNHQQKAPSPSKPLIIDIKCDMCPKSFNSCTRFNAHLLAAHPLEDVTSVKFQTRSRRSGAKCADTKQTKKIKCHLCSWSCPNVSRLKDHMNYSHLINVLVETVPVPEPDANAKCTQVVGVIFDEMSRGGSACFQCGKVITGLSNLTRHAVRSHLDELTDKVRMRINADEDKGQGGEIEDMSPISEDIEVVKVLQIRDTDDIMSGEKEKEYEIITLD